MESFYLKLKFNSVKFNNFQILSPNFAAPSSPIPLPLKIRRFKIVYNLFIQRKIYIINISVNLPDIQIQRS